MEIQDLDIVKKDDYIDNSSQNLAVFKRNEVNIGDLEEMELTSKSYKIKTIKTKKFCNDVLLQVLIAIFIIYLSILYLYPFISSIKNINIRRMTQQNGNIGINQNYERIDPDDKNYTYIPIVGTDDIHGHFFPKINNIRIGKKSFMYKTGGLEYMAKYITTLREEFGSNRVLYFDGGDFYQGGIASVLFDGEIMLEYFNIIGLNGSTIGNHEFDYSREWVESKIEKSNFKVLVNNIRDDITLEKNGALGENQETSHLYEITLENGDTINIGVIGLSFNMKNDKTIPNTWGNRDTWDNISFFNYIDDLEQESYKLRQNGASAVLALTHFGIVCNQSMAMKLDMYNISSIQGECYREDEDSALYKLLDALKPGILDGIIGGDTHMEMHHWINDIPIMSVPKNARYLNIMYLPFQKGYDGKYYLVPDEVKIEGPLPACEKIFKNYQNCELISPKEYEEAGELINYYWHGKLIESDPIVDPIYDKYYQRYKDYAEQKIVTFQGFEKIYVDKSGDCILCNTYLDAIKEIKNADFAIINRGIFPEELVPGTLNREDFYNQMPYLDRICLIEITGEELKKIVGTVQSLGKSFYPTSSLRQTIKINSTTGNKTVTNIELYINDEPIPIEDERKYIMASSKYVLSESSGDDFRKGDAFKIIHEKAINHEIECSERTLDDEIAEFFKGRGNIDLSNKVSAESPRIIKIIE